MRKWLQLIVATLLCVVNISCGDSLSDEQRPNSQTANEILKNKLVGTWVSRPYQNDDNGNITLELKSNGTGCFSEMYETHDYEEWIWFFSWSCIDYGEDKQLVLTINEEGVDTDLFYHIIEITSTKLVLIHYGMLEANQMELYREDSDDSNDDIFKSNSQESYTIDANGNTIDISITTNIEYEVVIPKSCKSWITITDSRSAIHNDILQIQIAANNTVEERKADIEIIEANGKKLDSFTILQDGYTLQGVLTLHTDKQTYKVGDKIYFTVADSNNFDFTPESVIFDANSFDEVTNPFTPTVDGKYKFYAVYGDAISNFVEVVVTPTVPALPEDAEPANTSFKHHILLVDHTGNTCSFCPRMMMALKEVEENGAYHGKYYEAMSHSYSTSDPASSSAAYAVTGHYNIGGDYPSLTYNFYHTKISSYNAEDIKNQIDALWKESADASVTASTSLATKSVVVNTAVKAAVAGEYSVTAWLLEDGIEAKQTGATADWMNIHNNAIRSIAVGDPISGYELGTIEAGKSAEQVLSLDITSAAWNRDNLKVMLIVSKKNEKGKFEVVNVAICPVNGSIRYEYNI